MPSSLMLRYEPGAVGGMNLYCGGTPGGVGELLAHLKLPKPTPQSSMNSRVSQLRRLQNTKISIKKQASRHSKVATAEDACSRAVQQAQPPC
jgi:hypothetical protein